MDRRGFLKNLVLASGFVQTGLYTSQDLFAQTNFSGKLLFSLQLDGGADVTSLCDPKTNVSGEREINAWARTADVRQAGNIRYAPFANNQQLFEKYAQNMLVINGVDAQTNSHSTGVIHNWSGRNADGYPTITALHAASNAPDLPLSYLNFGGFGNTQGLTRSSRISDIDNIQKILFPNRGRWNDINYRRTSDFQRIKNLQLQMAERLASETNIPQGQARNRRVFHEALTQSDGLNAFANALPTRDQLQQERQLGQDMRSTLHQQIQVSMIAMQAGVTIAADLFETGYDTHQDHDAEHTLLLNNFADAMDYFWTTAEQMGLADRILLLIGSDFGRTPHYNSGEGKDHWPIGSNIIMEKNVGWTNRVFGETDEGHNAGPVNLQTGQSDTVNGSIIHPKHVHLALRKYLGLHNNGITNTYPFNNTEDFAFFS